MASVLITGSAGLIGSEAVRFFGSKGYSVIGLDNDMRREFFGAEASTDWNRKQLEEQVKGYSHHSVDIRNEGDIDRIFSQHNKEIALVIHTAAQPSHDWAARAPLTDFSVNALGTLVLLEATRKHCPDAVFIFTSTNKVYGDTPNMLPLVENETRWEPAPDHPYSRFGIDETMSIDQSKHSVFGASKVAADVMVQEYGRYFGLKTGVFRGGCLTGGNHSGTALHGFLSYLMLCCLTGRPYSVYGYKAKQVRDNIHAFDLINMFWHFFQKPRAGEVYNAGGSRHSHCSMLEAISLCEELCGKKLAWEYSESNRSGDHIWYVSDVRKFQAHFPDWKYQYDGPSLFKAIHQGWVNRLAADESRRAA
jgi:CDP-paratose 2-epimerase